MRDVRDARPRRWSARLPLTLTLTLSSSTVLAASADIPPHIQDAARRLIAERTQSTPDEVELLGAATVAYPLQNRITYQFKGAGAAGDLAGVALDPNVTEVNADALNATEDALRVERDGRASAALVEVLARTPDDQTLDVTLWARPADGVGEGLARPDVGAELSDDEVDRLYQQQQAWLKQASAAATGPLLERLAELGVEAQADEQAPLVHVKLTPAQAREVARLDEVVEADVAVTYEAQLDVSRATVEADIVHGWGITGSNVRKAVVEVGGRVLPGNPWLSGFFQYLPFSCFNVHANAVLGVVASTHPTHRGMSPAPASTFVGGDCFGFNSRLQSVTNAAINWNARAINLSWGSQAGSAPGSMDRYYDSVVMNNWRTVVAAAGNNASQVVASPARAYNVLGVGNFNDFNSVPWPGDVMDASSAWLNPSSTVGDREKPDLAAPGTNVTTTSGSFPWLFTPAISSARYGTSLSAPHVTGVSALMMQRNSSLTVWPEAVRSILMATAVHNIEGATRLSSRDGAGAIVASQADDVSRNIDGGWGALGYSCASPYTMDLTTMPLWANRPARIVIAWDTNPNYGSYAARPSADIDMSILSPTNSYVAGSASWDNTYEIVEFTPPVAGSYKLRITKYRCDLTPMWLGWAWYQNR
jgi:hypothetical protein